MDENNVYVGGKPVGSYIGAVLTQFGQFDEVNLLARGQENIGKAVDVAEIISKSHEKEIANIVTGTDSREDTDTGETYRVSNIKITLSD